MREGHGGTDVREGFRDGTRELGYVLQQVSYHSPQTSLMLPDQIEPKLSPPPEKTPWLPQKRKITSRGFRDCSIETLIDFPGRATTTATGTKSKLPFGIINFFELHVRG